MTAAIALPARILNGFDQAFGHRPTRVARAPGRVNLIGEHTDYNGGFALPCAIGAETRVALSPRDDGQIRVIALDLDGAKDSFALDAIAPHGGWRDYVRGVVQVARQRRWITQGANIAIAGSIARGTGLSSSASLEMALLHALVDPDVACFHPRAAALAGQKAENQFVGVQCGALDQLASASCIADHALLIDFATLETRAVPLPADTSILIVQSGVKRGLLDGAYNARRRECEEAAAAAGAKSLRAVDLDALTAARDRMSEDAFRRARHVLTDNARTLAMVDDMRAADLCAIGRRMRDSHASMRDDFGATVDHTDRLAAILNDSLGDQGGARQTGGGFGGAVVALGRTDVIAQAAIAVQRHYRTPNGAEPVMHVERAAAGAGLVEAY